MNANEILKDKKTKYFFLILFFFTTLIYLNHFDNGFHFDDSHAILNNPNIRSLKNIPSFFIDGTTSSTTPQNQMYRPIVTTSLAIDYWLANGYKPFFFHLSNYLFFLLQGLLLFLFIYKILEQSYKNKYTFYISAASTLFYMIHPVMAETVNYIIARSDIQSTFFVVLAFVLYQYSKVSRKYYLHLIPVVIGTLAKPTAIMFFPLFFVYYFLFENKIETIYNRSSYSIFLNTLKKTSFVAITCIGLYFIQDILTPKTFTPGNKPIFNYLITQPPVLSYYFGSLFLPIHLSADTDWKILDSIWSYPFILGFIFISTLLTIALITLKNRKLFPIGFGILWFFIALIPTSSIIPLAEVMNDHRMFFPYIGLVLSLGWALGLLYEKLKPMLHWKLNDLIIVSIILFGIYGFGTFQRNIVWDNNESLWKDVVQKSPKNGRGLMNYGVEKMRTGQYIEAKKLFEKALIYSPSYYSLHINLGIINNATGNIAIAEEYYKKAIQYGPNYYTPWFYYGDFLTKHSRYKDAIDNLEKSLSISPNHLQTIYLLLKNYSILKKWNNLETLAIQTLKIDSKNKIAQKYLISSQQRVSIFEEENKISPSKKMTANDYLQLSIKYYKSRQYKQAIELAEKQLELQPNSEIAYNNICSAYNELNMLNKAEIACNKAISLKADFQLAKNNLKSVLYKKNTLTNALKLVTEKGSEVHYINLSMIYYKYGQYEKCIKIALEGLKKYPKSSFLYNNLCVTYNGLKDWKKAIEAGKKGLEINPNYQLLKNNYNYSLSKIKE